MSNFSIHLKGNIHKVFGIAVFLLRVICPWEKLKVELTLQMLFNTFYAYICCLSIDNLDAIHYNFINKTYKITEDFIYIPEYAFSVKLLYEWNYHIIC